MGKSTRSALLFEGFVLVAALVALVSILLAGPGHEQALLQISLVLAGVIVAGLLTFVLMQRTLEREMLVRRFFVSPHWIYNHEIGYAPLDGIAPNDNVYGFVTFAAEALARMSYGFEVANTPSSFEPEYIIESSAFLFHSTDEDDDEGAVVVDTWEGTLLKVDNPRDGKSSQSEVGNFSNAGDLARLIEEVEAVTPLEQEVVG